MHRFRDNGETIYSLRDEFWVQCPRCNSCAKIHRIEPDNTDMFAPRRFSCTACGSSKNWSGQQIGGGSRYDYDDPYFHYTLWLQAPCCGQTLWAYNLRHFVEWLKHHVKAL